MKIGILSMQKILNYGSFLQAFSLKKQLEQRGHDVYFIDIEPGKQISSVCDAEQATPISSKFDKYFLKRIQNYFMYSKMSKIHINDYTTYLNTDKKLSNTEKFDLVVIGSDEVFNCLTPSPWGVSLQLFGKIDNAKKVVTYAASCGATTYDAVLKAGIADELKNTIKNISDISVRDANTFEFVEKLTAKSPTTHLDPVFISDYDDYVVEKKFKKPYLLVYAYSNRITNVKEIDAIKKYAKNNNLDILCVGMQQRWCKNNICASAFELLGYVKNAACVVTDTFHGAVFSIKFNKPFCVFVRESNNNKLMGLLNTFQLSKRACTDFDIESILNEEIDFSVANNIILKGRNNFNQYFNNILGE